MYFPTTRVLTVLELLQSHAQLSGPELAERLEVNIRTVRRYITMLQDLSIPVEAGRGRYGSYRLRPGFKLPPLMFNEDEALALTLGLIAARKLGLAVAAPSVEGALAKIERVLPLALRSRVQAVQETIVFDFVRSGVMPNSDIVVTLSTAIQQCRRVGMHYLSLQSEETNRVVDLYGLVYRGGYWYAVGYCHLREGVRIFRLDRVLQAETQDEAYTRPVGFDALEYVIRSLTAVPNNWPVEVLLETTIERAHEMIPPTLATLEEVDEGVMLHCSFGYLDGFAHFLAGLECPFVVRKPPELREELKRLAERITTMAERSA